MHRAEEAASLFHSLARAEETHGDALARLYLKLVQRELPRGFPDSEIPGDGTDRMEGGLTVAECLAWARGKPPGEALELAMSLEANSYDLYLTMHRLARDEEAREVFFALAEEEKLHLERLTRAFEATLG
jgi:rubrerythrin